MDIKRTNIKTEGRKEERNKNEAGRFETTAGHNLHQHPRQHRRRKTRPAVQRIIQIGRIGSWTSPSLAGRSPTGRPSHRPAPQGS